jgi:hypothetical protein
VDSECTLYFLSDFEGRYHVMIEFLLKKNIIEVTEDASKGETYITWNDPKVFVVQCGDAIDDLRWAAPEVSGTHVEKHPEDLGRDLDAWFVFDYLRRISGGNFINIFGNHDIWNMQKRDDNKYNISVLYPEAKYVTKDDDGKTTEYSRTDFAKRFVFPFYSISFVYVLRVADGATIIASHAGVHPDYLNDLKQFMADVHVHEDIANIINSHDVDPSNKKGSETRYKLMNDLMGVTTTRIFNHMCTDTSAINVELLDKFNAVKESYVQVLGHNKEGTGTGILIRDVYMVPGDKCVQNWEWDGKSKFHVACMVDALSNEKSPKRVKALMYSKKKFEKIETKCDETYDGVDSWYAKLRKIISDPDNPDNLYTLAKGENKKKKEEEVS